MPVSLSISKENVIVTASEAMLSEIKRGLLTIGVEYQNLTTTIILIELNHDLIEIMNQIAIACEK